MKVIAFYPGVYPNGYAPMSFRLHYYMKALQCNGVDVEIVLPIESNASGGFYDDIPYRYHTVSRRTRINKLKITNEYARICEKLAKECDVLFTTFYNSKIARTVHKNGGKIAIEINENPYSIIGSRLNFTLERNIMRKWFLFKTIKSFDGVITISQALNDLINKYKRSDARIIKVPILTGSKDVSVKIHHENCPYILHAGALSEQKDGVKAMFKAFAIAHKELNGNLKFIFTNKVGFPSLLKWIEVFIKQNNLQKAVEFKGIVPLNELSQLYDGCALAIINKPANSQNNYNFPTKLTELLPRKIPVIVSKTGELKRFFIDNENAFMTEPNDYHHIAKHIVDIIRNPENAFRIAQNAKILAENRFFYQNYSAELTAFFMSINNTHEH